MRTLLTEVDVDNKSGKLAAGLRGLALGTLAIIKPEYPGSREYVVALQIVLAG